MADSNPLGDTASLVGDWVHLHEEDDAEHRVFCRAGADLPPSRGRSVLTVRPDLSVERAGPGADDRPQTAGSQRVSRLRIGFADDAIAPDLKVASVSADRLMLLKE